MSTLSAGSLKPGAAAEPPLGLHLPLRVQQGQQGLSCCPHPPQRWLQQQQQQRSPRCTHHPCQRRPPIQTQAIIISVFHRANGLSGNRLFFSPFFFLAFKTHEYGSSENRELGTVEWSTGSSEPSAGVTLSP